MSMPGGAVALPAPRPLALGSLIDALAGLAQHRWLDRLIRGRAWIALVAFALIGIVAMQLWIVKLGVGIGRALEHEALLQRENATLSIEDAKLSSGERVEALAAARGMIVAAPGALRFESIRRGLDARLAAAALARGTQTPSAASTASAVTAATETAPASTAEASSQQTASPSTAEASSQASATGTSEASQQPAATGAGDPSQPAAPTNASETQPQAAPAGTSEGQSQAAPARIGEVPRAAGGGSEATAGG
ncbi:MAG TPA: hypothetical protein VK756_10630 [Solirubrobacteraceae bacterium]|nr:hypothetical protein [Solirubrobacteraceae bacterium]